MTSDSLNTASNSSPSDGGWSTAAWIHPDPHSAPAPGPQDSFATVYPEISNICRELWERPELGYREHNASALIETFIARHAPQSPITRFSTTGISVAFPAAAAAPEAAPDLAHAPGLEAQSDPMHERDRPDQGESPDQPRKRARVAVVAELDAVISPAHPAADPATGAVHACGHHTQVGIALSVLHYLATTGAWQHLGVDVSFVFVPSEEFVDLTTRDQLRTDGLITWYGGKSEAMMLGVFDDIDAAICLHAIGGRLDEPTIEIDCDLAGFLYKTITFRGRASHAGLDPFSAVNAQSMAVLFQNALALGRQQLREDVLIRMNPVVPTTSMTTNVVPHEAVVGTDVRSTDLDYLAEVARRVDDAAHGCAKALGGEAEIRTDLGYMPLVQDRTLNGAFRAAFDAQSEMTHLIDDRGAIAAAGDAGDLSYLMPTVQLSYGGFDGTIHGRDFAFIDPATVLVSVPRLVADALHRMHEHLPSPLWRRSFAEYEAALAAIGPLPERTTRTP